MNENAVILKPGREKPVRQGHPWIFSGAIARLPGAARDGDVVSVTTHDGTWLARGLLNRTSQIQVRLLTWEIDDVIDDAFWRQRMEQAIRRRNGLLPITNALRLINAESDYLPGLTVDRYDHWLVLQAGALGVDQRKQELAAMLLELTGCVGVVERSEAMVRRHEGLQPATGVLAGVAPDAPVEVYEDGLRFVVDVLAGQKTGFYTDQRANRRRVATYCAGKRVLNAFSYTGAFAVHALAAGAIHVTNLDSNLEALQLVEENLRRNGFDPETHSENIVGDVFQILRDWRHAASAPLFDVIVLDPPKFAQSQAQVERALRGYKEINLQALHLLAPEGILATFSCSGLVGADLFQKVVFGAAVDARRQVQVLEWLRQDSDHPVAITFPEGNYLNGLICRAT
jgi:23S rRNA (cytosine1962-C5)-methyltransferase